MVTKPEILDLIRQLAAKNGGKAPGSRGFEISTGIREGDWRGKYWSKWSRAISEAGLSPNEMNSLHDEASVLTHYLMACRQVNGLATNAELQIYAQTAEGAPSKNAWTTRFDGIAGLRLAARNYAAQQAEWADVMPMLSGIDDARKESIREAFSKDGWVYLLKGLPGYYKIGRGEDLERRVKQVSVAMPEKVELEHSIKTDDPAGIEAYWHRRFADRRANGEWFKLTREDIRAFKRRKFQ